MHAVRDLFWLSAHAADTAETPWSVGTAATASWLRGGRTAPITDRPGPASRAAAVVEMWSALAVADMSSNPPLQAVSAQHGLAYLEPRMLHPEVAMAVQATCGWVTGVREQPPMELPRRLFNGRLATVDDIINAALRVRPVSTPEQRADVSRAAEQEAARSARLAALITDTSSAA